MRLRPALLCAIAAVCTVVASVHSQTTATPIVIHLDGELTGGDYERLLERDFSVPAGTRRIEVELEYSGAERRTVLDLGLRGPGGLRGWSGGGRRHIEVSALTATPGYLPGAIEAGTWAVLLGVPNIRPDSRDRYSLVVRLHGDDRGAGPIVNATPGWYVGDLHTHSMHSDGRATAKSGAQTPTPPFRVFEQAATAGLDFINLSDHNTVSHWLDVDRLQPYFDRTLLLHGRELTTYRGHATTVGERRFNEFRLPFPLASPADLLARMHDTTTFVSINHPTSADDETCMGCGWNVVDDDVMRQIDGVEIVNGVASDEAGWRFWAALLNRGFHLTAVGGSDEHTVDDPTDRSIGTPSTVVYASALSEPALVEGLKSGRVYVRTEGPKGPSLDFAAEIGAARHQMGATIIAAPRTTLRLSAMVTGADGQTLEWIRNGVVFATDTIGTRPLIREVTALAPEWFSVKVRRDRTWTLYSNAIYVARSSSSSENVRP